MCTVRNIAAVIWIESGDTAFFIRKPYVGQYLACGGLICVGGGPVRPNMLNMPKSASEQSECYSTVFLLHH